MGALPEKTGEDNYPELGQSEIGWSFQIVNDLNPDEKEIKTLEDPYGMIE